MTHAPDLTDAEWNVLNPALEEEIEKPDKFIDSATKWLYVSKKGHSVFALYGIGKGDEPTVLYAVGGRKAESIYADWRIVIDGDDRSAKTRSRMLSSVRAYKRVGGLIDRYAGYSGEAGENAGLVPGERGSNPGGNNAAGNRAGESRVAGTAVIAKNGDAVMNQHREDIPETLEFLNAQIESGNYTTIPIRLF